jgi:hypothetical protein
MYVHFHSFLPDGVFHEPEPGTLRFFKLPPPSDEDVAKLLHRIGRRVEELVSYWETAPTENDEALASTLAETKERRRGFWYEDDIPMPQKPRCAFVDG